MAASYVLIPLAPVPALLVSDADDVITECVGGCPRNVLLVEHDAGLSDAALALGAVLTLGLCLVAVGMLVRQWRAASAPERRSLVPLFASGGVTLALVAAYATSQVDALLWMAFAAFAATPFAFLAGLGRGGPLRLARRPHLDGGARRHAEPRGPAGRPRPCARRPQAGARVLDAGAQPLRRRGRIRRPPAARGRPAPHRDRDPPPRRVIRSELPRTGVVVLSPYVKESYAIQLLEESAAGVGYLLKDRVMEPRAFAEAARQVARGGSALDPEVVAHMLERRRRGGPLDELSGHELDVLARMAEGRSNLAIATDLGISEHTLRRSIAGVFGKLDLPVGAEGHRRVLAVLTYIRAQES